MQINNNIKVLVAIALSSVMTHASSNTIDISSNQANLSDNKWTFSDVVDPAVALSWINVASGSNTVGVNNVPPDSTYNGNFQSDANYNGFWTATYSFTSSYPGIATLNISLFAADDRAQVYLNCDPALSATCSPIDSAGLFAPGTGSFQSTYAGNLENNIFYNATPNLDNYGNKIIKAENVNAGTNTIEVIINNTNTGIDGSLTTGGPTHFTLQGTIDLQDYAISEPSSILLIWTAWLAFAILQDKRRMYNS